MAAITYDKIRPDLQYVADELTKNGISYKAYNSGVQFNATDLEGVIHTFYPTTGTVILHASNDRNDRRTKTFTDKTLEDFIKGMKFKNLVEHYFKEVEQ